MRTRHEDLLSWDLASIRAYLDGFDRPANGEAREVETNATGELVIIRNMPLPDGLHPDYIDLLMMAPDYPIRPPIGIYLLERDNGALIQQLRRIFNVMNTAFHDAQTVEGYVWICVHYQNNAWRYNPNHPATGDNLTKFIIHFFNSCHDGRDA